MRNTVIGVFESPSNAKKAAQELLDNGFNSSNVDLLIQESAENREYSKREKDDSISGFFQSLFGDNDEANNHYYVAERGAVITVHTDTMEEAERAADLLDQNGAVNANETVSQMRGNTQTQTSTGTTNRDMTGENTIPIIEEKINVGKREVNTGGVRLRSRIVEKPVEQNLRLRTEHVTVERNRVDRAVTGADMENFKEGTIEVTEKAEVANVQKEARVVEEVKIKKEVENRDETIRESVRRQDVDVEKIKKDKERNK